MKTFSRFFTVLAGIFLTSEAFADFPRPWQMGFQEPATPVMKMLNDFHNLLLVFVFVSGIFVFLLMSYVVLRFNAKSNPVASKTTHNTLLEIIWTVVPTVVLIFIAIPSMHTLFFSSTIKDAQMTIKVIGYQWYWGYKYPDQGIAFESNIKQDKDLKPGDIRLLSTDNQVVVPVDTTIRVQITAADVIHSWAVPSFGVKMDAVPGRLNETWFKVDKPGIYYGQCSELCGVNHGFMPIEVKAVSKEEFAKWVEEAKKKFADKSGQSNQVAALSN